MVPPASKPELDVRIWITLLYSGQEEPMYGWLMYLLQCGKKECDWEDDSIKTMSQTFLTLTERATEAGKVHNLTHPRAWSNALDLIARIGEELDSEDILQGAIYRRLVIDQAHEVPLEKQLDSSFLLSRVVHDVEHGDGCGWANINWWITMHRDLRERVMICDHVIGELNKHINNTARSKYVYVGPG